MDGLMEGSGWIWMDLDGYGWMEGWKDGWMEGWLDGRMIRLLSLIVFVISYKLTFY